MAVILRNTGQKATGIFQARLRSAAAILLGLAVILGLPVQAAEIYRTVDAEGNVVFTDIPPREDDQNAEQIIIENPNSFVVDEAIPNADEWIVEPEDGQEEEPPFSYLALEIVAPADDEPVRENAGNITVVTNIHPRLQRGHRTRLLMDGTVVQEGSQGSFDLANVDRGTHTIAVEIVDERGQVLIRSEQSTFHMLRFAGGARS
jgi:hypothetical protein